MPRVSGWAVGGISFAGSIMILIGTFQALNGIVAIANENFFVVTRNYTFNLDVKTWGWIHLILGVAIFLTALALFAGRTWAGVTALALAILSAVNNFFFIPHYPWWSLLIIALDVWVIWSLTRPGAVKT
jgi:hypothetical protein